jgi:hypothetical protein
LNASTAPDPTPVYDGVGTIDSNINEFNIIIDFDAVNPPEPNTKFTIYIVDVINSISLTSIATVPSAPYVQTWASPIKFIAGTNLNTTNSILLHDTVNSVGLPDTTTLNPYGLSVTFNYIIDVNNDDRLLATSLVGTSVF